eukprot:365353-Chlamydomonas_euryale.AAC.20
MLCVRAAASAIPAASLAATQSPAPLKLAPPARLTQMAWPRATRHAWLRDRGGRCDPGCSGCSTAGCMHLWREPPVQHVGAHAAPHNTDLRVLLPLCQQRHLLGRQLQQAQHAAFPERDPHLQPQRGCRAKVRTLLAHVRRCHCRRHGHDRVTLRREHPPWPRVRCVEVQRVHTPAAQRGQLRHPVLPAAIARVQDYLTGHAGGAAMVAVVVAAAISPTSATAGDAAAAAAAATKSTARPAAVSKGMATADSAAAVAAGAGPAAAETAVSKRRQLKQQHDRAGAVVCRQRGHTHAADHGRLLHLQHAHEARRQAHVVREQVGGYGAAVHPAGVEAAVQADGVVGVVVREHVVRAPRALEGKAIHKEGIGDPLDGLHLYRHGGPRGTP